jgi:hypothetical protein
MLNYVILCSACCFDLPHCSIQTNFFWILHMSACTVFETTEVKPAYRVQLTPSDVPCSADLLIQAWLYNSLFVRVRSSTLARDELDYVLQQREPAVRGALYCAIPEYCFQPAFAVMLRSRGYAFWNHEPTTNELIYYKWCGPQPDMVPHYSTSIEGGGLIALSPDESKVLLVFELGRWCFPGGAVEFNETCQEAALREAKEETGVQIDHAFPIRLVGGWNLGTVPKLQLFFFSIFSF